MCDPVDQLMHRVSEWFVRQPRGIAIPVLKCALPALATVGVRVEDRTGV